MALARAGAWATLLTTFWTSMALKSWYFVKTKFHTDSGNGINLVHFESLSTSNLLYLFPHCKRISLKYRQSGFYWSIFLLFKLFLRTISESLESARTCRSAKQDIYRSWFKDSFARARLMVADFSPIQQDINVQPWEHWQTLARAQYLNIFWAWVKANFGTASNWVSGLHGLDGWWQILALLSKSCSVQWKQLEDAAMLEKHPSYNDDLPIVLYLKI